MVEKGYKQSFYFLTWVAQGSHFVIVHTVHALYTFLYGFLKAHKS